MAQVLSIKAGASIGAQKLQRNKEAVSSYHSRNGFNSKKVDTRKFSRVVLNAVTGPPGVEPDLPEVLPDRHGTAGEEMERDGTFKYGKIDGHHTFHEGHEGTLIENWTKAVEEAGGPQGSQKWLSYLFLPNLFAMVGFNVHLEYLVAYTFLFIFAFIGLEMAKPDTYLNYEPEMYQKKD